VYGEQYSGNVKKKSQNKSSCQKNSDGEMQACLISVDNIAAVPLFNLNTGCIFSEQSSC